MIQYSGNFESKKDTPVSVLPAGVYIGKVLGAKVESQTIGGKTVDRLVLQLDVTEGEHKDHYVKQYEAASGGQYPAKFKGVLRLTIPKPGDQYEDMNKRFLQNAAWALEESNKGYHWDWDESKLKGLAVGFAVRDADALIDDDQGVRMISYTEICRLESIPEIKAGKVQTPKRRGLKDAQKRRLAEYSAQVHGFTEVSADEELPF